MRFIFIFLLFPFFTVAQNCSICPSGTTVNLLSSYSPTAAHQWTCTNGFTSNLVNPTFAPIADVTCNLLVTENGCTATSQSIVDVCNCDCNDPCVSMDYNSTTDCVTFNNTGSNCSPTATDVIQWKNQNTSFATIANGGQVCNCNIKEYVNTTASATVVSTNFRLNVLGLQNRCSMCSGSNMRIDYQFPLSGSTTSFPGCAATDDWITISPAQFATNGYVCDAYVRYTTPFGVVVNQYRYQYNGGGLSAANVTVTQIAKRSIYKDITARRTVTYTDGCPQEQCELTLDIPQQPNDPCAHFVAYVSNVNLGAPCSGAGYSATTINATGTVTYQWYYNGTLLAGQTSQFFCLVGQPFGTYCVQITDGAGCSENVCRVYQASCTLTTSITASGNILTAVNTGCVGTATYQWQRWNGTSFVNVGTNSSTYNTGGLAGDYRVNVTCSGPPVCNAIANYTFTPPCTADVTITTGTTILTANVTGCGGTNINYVWERWNGTSWVTVQTITTTSTSNVYTPTVSGLYRVSITCNGCSDQAQTTWTAPNPCTGFSATMTGTFTAMCQGDTRTFGRTTTGGTAPFTQVWTLNGSTVGTGTTYNFTSSVTGTYAISVTVTDLNGCSFTDTRNITVIQCCAMTLSISPTSTTVCTNQDATFTVTPSGGTAPYTYVWTYNLQPSGAIMSIGSGNPKTINLPNAGTYNVVCTVTDALGCQVSIFAILTVTNCTNCTCTPTLTLTGCILNGAFNGAGCGNYSYQLQYSLTGTGWSVVASGIASPSGTITHNPTANGFYRLVIAATGGSGCNTQSSPDVGVTCVTSCNCTAGILSYSSSTCQLSWNNQCSGYIANLQKQNGASWTYVTNTSPYSNPSNGVYRVQYQKGGCSDVYSNQVTVIIPSCNYFQYYDPDIYFADVYYPIIAVPNMNISTSNLSNRVVCSNAYCDYPFNSTYFTNSTIAWGDGSPNYTSSTNDYAIYHTYNTNGAYKIEFDRNSSFGITEQNSYCYPNGSVNIPIVILEPVCGDGGVPIYYTLDGCDNINIYILYFVYGINNATMAYNSHSVTINGVSYTVPLTVFQGPPNEVWQIYNTTPIVLSKSSINNNTIPINISVTINGNQTLINNGYFRIECN